MDDPDVNELAKKAALYESKYLAVKSDFKNFVDSCKRNEIAKKAEIQSDNARKMLVLADSLVRVSSQARSLPSGTNTVADPYVQNTEAMYRQLLDICRLTPIDPAPGDTFNDTLHMAVGLEYRSRFKEGSVYSVVRRGYRQEELLIRPAEVIVAKDSREEPASKTGFFRRIFSRIFPAPLTEERFELLADRLEHTRSETMVRIEQDISRIQGHLEGMSEDLSETCRTGRDFEEKVALLEEQSQQTALSLREIVREVRDLTLIIHDLDERMDEMDRRAEVQKHEQGGSDKMGENR